MGITDVRLALLTFAQRWTPGALNATVLLVPSGDPTQPLFPGAVPFAGADVRLRVAAVAGLDAMPTLGVATDTLTLTPPANAAALFGQLVSRFSPQDTTVGPPPPAPPQSVLRKALPDTYLAALPPGRTPSRYVGSADEFGCTMRGQVPQPPVTTRPDPSWGEVLSHALRNPALADALGLRYTFTVPIADPTPYADGGWLYVTLDPADAGTGYAAAWALTADAVKVYASRLPALAATQRAIFTAVLFPVANPAAPPTTPDEAALDEAIIEAEAYDDGFAKLIHARQPDTSDAHVGDGKTNVNAATDVGIQIGWDDEQVLSWHNRQIEIAQQALTNAPIGLESPLGVQGYRVDVREPVPGESGVQRNFGWASLMSATGTPPPPLDALVANFDGELVVEPTASAPATPGARPTEFWLPLYFASWRGTPLGVRDDTPHLLSGGVAAGKQSAVVPSAFTGKEIPALLYGHTYELRVRLGDQSGGGPTVDDLPINDTVAERARVSFARYVSPNSFGVSTPVPATEVTLRRPTIGYPEALFTTRYGTRPEVRVAARAAMLAQLGLDPVGGPLPVADRVPDKNTVGVPDPDVSSFEIRVEARALAHDTGDDVSADGVFTTVYTTTRPVPPLAPLPAGAVTAADTVADVAIPPLVLDFVDVDDIATLTATASGALPVPRARDVRLVLTPIASGPDGYFGAIDPDVGRPQPNRGASSHLRLRAEAAAEADALFAPPPDGRPAVQAFFFQRSGDGDPVAAMVAALAGAVGLDYDGLTLRARPGERVAFGMSAGVANTISPDGASLTFAAAADIFRKWTVALRYDLQRDWTWDGLDNGQVVVSNGGNPIGSITVPRVASSQALGGTPDRSRTRLVFFDGIDPAVQDPRDGFTDRAPYTLSATMFDEAGGDLSATTDPVALRLPVVVPPAGVPKLVSAGYSLSPYEAAADYSSTGVRSRHLWLEVEKAPDPGDALFARPLAYGPDPLLYVDAEVLRAEPPAEPALRLDPELVRVITANQPRDDDGLEAMIRLVPSADDPTRFQLPLPDGVEADDPRLFGMWSYEVRFGHVDPWSTAHGRFSRPLRVTGVQHPAPHLPCAATWRPLGPPGIPLGNDLVASAPYATPVLDGRRVGDGIPRSTLGFLLYAQARQADGSGYRNVLIDHHGAHLMLNQDQVDYGSTAFPRDEILRALRDLGLPEEASLSVLAVEFYSPGGSVGTEYHNVFVREHDQRPFDAVGRDPFGSDFFGQQRILRTSPLVRVEPVC
jgi:hypothetical protein